MIRSDLLFPYIYKGLTGSRFLSNTYDVKRLVDNLYPLFSFQDALYSSSENGFLDISMEVHSMGSFLLIIIIYLQYLVQIGNLLKYSKA